MSFFIQQFLNSLPLGAVYALIAIGYSLMFGVLRLFNFALGDIYMVGAYTGFFVLAAFGGPGGLAAPAALVIVCMVVAGALSSGLLGAIVERVAFRPLRDAPLVAPLITSLGVSFVLEYSVLLLFSADPRFYFTPEWVPYHIGFRLDGTNIWVMDLVVLGGAFALMIALDRLIDLTNLGRQMRAVATDRDAARMVGIDVDRVISRAFFIGSALAGAAGVGFALVFSEISFDMGFTAGLIGFAAAVVGGMGSVRGAVLGGFVIGFAQDYSSAYISSTEQDLITFALLVAVLLLRPRGLLGRPALQRV
ncbi:MAG TPA: branched-chain amino acid ABC transporter permease [Acidimicrobiales bacterium]|nr:branched-chain amino acid ABC transporter permease [Acidimicrobiales bacterium]